MLVHCSKSTEVEWRYTEEGEKVRVSTRTGRIIPLSIILEETKDYKTKSSYKGNCMPTALNNYYYTN